MLSFMPHPSLACEISEPWFFQTSHAKTTILPRQVPLGSLRSGAGSGLGLWLARLARAQLSFRVTCVGSERVLRKASLRG
jgi:hypothetical protein